ncbi:MAG: hypothetical protein ACI835_005090 [Planctomycetota bacterium]|jgi:hypothetical protein
MCMLAPDRPQLIRSRSSFTALLDSAKLTGGTSAAAAGSTQMTRFTFVLGQKLRACDDQAL